MSEYVHKWPTVDYFTDIMKSKLDANTHKGMDGAWRKLTVGVLFKLLVKEIDELENIIDKHGNVPQGFKNTKLLEDDIAIEVSRECADVANYAMMIADTMKRLTMPQPEQDSSKMPNVDTWGNSVDGKAPNGILPDVVPTPKSTAQVAHESEWKPVDKDDIPF